MNDYNNFDNSVKIKKYIKYGIILVFILIMGLIYYINFYDNSNSTIVVSGYDSLKEDIINKTKSYIANNNITIIKETYYSLNQINYNIDDTCDSFSGVFVDQYGNYDIYLKCDKYNSPSLNSKEGLRGSEVLFLNSGSYYSESGLVGDDCNNENTCKIYGSVGTSNGVYNLTYSKNNNTYHRKVVVINNTSLFPTLKLNGSSLEEALQDDIYTDPGVVAIDNVDGNITNNVKINGFVNTTEVGSQDIYYTVTNSRGYTTTLKRTVVVTKNTGSSYLYYELNTTNYTSSNVIANITIFGDDFSYVELPDNSKKYESNFEYSFKDNGTYYFKVYDKDGFFSEYDIVISNMATQKPTGTCKAVLTDNKVTITVDASSNYGIAKYTYKIDGATSSSTSNGITITKDYTSYAKVIIIDNLNNNLEIDCTITDNQTGFTEIISKRALDKPITEALSNKGHSVTDLNTCISSNVTKYGAYTGRGVAAAGYYLIKCMKDMTGYTMHYDHTGGKVEGSYCSFNKDICGKLGINTRWGTSGGTGKSTDTDQRYGLNCATSVRWAMCNGGMDLCTKGSAGAGGMISTTYFPEAYGVVIENNTVKNYSKGTKDISNLPIDTLLQKIRPGDVIHSINAAREASSEHAMLVIGNDGSKIYIAEDGQNTRAISYKSIKTSGTQYRILYLDEYYANKANRNNLY